LLLIKVLASLTGAPGIFLTIWETNGSVGRWETKHFIGMEFAQTLDFPLLSEPLRMISLATDFRTKGAVHSTLVLAP